MLDRAKKIHLVERILGLKHKLKVNESGPTPQNHKEMASLLVAHWELEDEISVIEELLQQQRNLIKMQRLAQIEKEYIESDSPNIANTEKATEKKNKHKL